MKGGDSHHEVIRNQRSSSPGLSDDGGGDVKAGYRSSAHPTYDDSNLMKRPDSTMKPARKPSRMMSASSSSMDGGNVKMDSHPKTSTPASSPQDEAAIQNLGLLLRDLQQSGGDSSAFLVTDMLLNTMAADLDNAPVQAFCLGTIWHFCIDSQEYRNSCASALGHVLLAMSAHVADAAVQERACGALWALAISAPLGPTMISMGAPQQLLAAISNHEFNESVNRTAVGCLRSLSPHQEMRHVCKNKLNGMNIIKIVCDCMKRHMFSVDIQRDGCAFLTNLAVEVECHNVAVATADEMEAIGKAMAAHRNAPQVTSAACFALKNYTYCQQNVQLLCAIDDFDINDLLEHLANESKDPNCQQDAKVVLERVQKLTGSGGQSVASTHSRSGYSTSTPSMSDEISIPKSGRGQALMSQDVHDAEDEASDEPPNKRAKSSVTNCLVASTLAYNPDDPTPIDADDFFREDAEFLVSCDIFQRHVVGDRVSYSLGSGVYEATISTSAILEEMETFLVNFDRFDSSTWEDALAMVPHVETLSRLSKEGNLRHEVHHLTKLARMAADVKYYCDHNDQDVASSLYKVDQGGLYSKAMATLTLENMTQESSEGIFLEILSKANVDGHFDTLMSLVDRPDDHLLSGTGLLVFGCLALSPECKQMKQLKESVFSKAPADSALVESTLEIFTNACFLGHSELIFPLMDDLFASLADQRFEQRFGRVDLDMWIADETVPAILLSLFGLAIMAHQSGSFGNAIRYLEFAIAVSKKLPTGSVLSEKADTGMMLAVAKSNGMEKVIRTFEALFLKQAVDTSEKEIRPSFEEYISGGCKVNVAVAIDFTSTNGNPMEEGTPHFVYDPASKEMNDYQKAISSVVSMLGKYDLRGLFPTWGFGARYNSKLWHCFQCGKNSQVEGVNGVLDAYRAVFDSGVTMSYPGELTEVIRNASQYAQHEKDAAIEDESNSYTVLVIFTAGDIDRILETKRELALASEKPLSVILVQMGNEDSTTLENLSQFTKNDEPGKARKLRDMTTLVRFNDFKTYNALQDAVLSNMPCQLVDYFVERNTLPGQTPDESSS